MSSMYFAFDLSNMTVQAIEMQNILALFTVLYLFIYLFITFNNAF
jgi:hypothetical protein